ncbi:MAG: glycosyltransferase [Lachnospiraceae bacterium]
MEQIVAKQAVKISVIMGVYNQWNKEKLRTAVDSILNQSMKEIEFIIWDDGSEAMAAEYIRELKHLDERIVLAGKEENKGLAFSLNSCIHLAKGKYIARMDADDISLENRLEREYEFLESHPEYAWCGCNAILFDESGTWGKRQMPEMPTEKDYLKYSPYIHPTVMFRKDLFEHHRGYLEAEETLRCEDYEIFMRFRRMGLRGYNLQETLFMYREDKENYKRRKFCFRINEMKLRYRNFRAMHLLFPFGWLYVIRPIVGGLLPTAILREWKRFEGKHAGEKAGEQTKLRGKENMPQRKKTNKALPENSGKGFGSQNSIA